MLLATYLKWDLRDVMAGKSIEDATARGRVQGLRELLEAAERATTPIYGGDLTREERLSRLASHEEDEDSLEVVREAYVVANGMKLDYFVERGQGLLAKIEEGRWDGDSGDRVFVEESLMPFLDRLERIADR